MKAAGEVAKTKTYKFGEYRLEAESLSLFREKNLVQLPPKTIEVLLALVESGGRVVTRDEITERVWAETFVEEANLTHHVSALRKTLGENGDGQKYIETIPRRGYRFVAEVREIAAGGAAEITVSERTTTRLVEQEIEIADARQPVERVSVEGESTGLAETSARQPEASAKKTQRGWRSLALAGTIAIVALAGIIYLLSLYLKPSPVKFQAGNITRLTAIGKIRHAAVSPDGKFVAYVQEDNQEERSLWLKHVASESNVNIIPSGKTGCCGLTFSPDNNYLYYIAKNSLYQMPVLGGMPKKVLDKVFPGRFPGGISFSPDGKQFAFVRYSRISESILESSIVIADANGTNEQILLAYQGSDSSVNGSPAWSPDGKTIIAPFYKSLEGTKVLAINVANKSVVKILPNGWDEIGEVKWLPDSKSFLVIGEFDENKLMLNQIWQISYPGGEVRRVNADFNNYSTVSLTADGRSLVATRTERVAHIWTMPSDDKNRIKQLTGGFERFDFVGTLAWMPDGKIMYGSLLDGKPLILVMNADGSDSTQLASGAVTAAASPDGRFLVYKKGSSRNGDNGFYRLDLSEMSEMRLTNGSDAFPAFSPDGKYFVFKRHDDQKAPILRVGIDGGEPILVTDSPNLNYPAISPDGKTVALANRNTQKLVLLPFEGGEPIKMFDVKFQPSIVASKSVLQWTPDGRAINYLVWKDNVSNIWRQPIDGGDPQQVTDFKDGLIFGFAFSPDGKQLALSRGTLNSDVVLIENQK